MKIALKKNIDEKSDFISDFLSASPIMQALSTDISTPNYLSAMIGSDWRTANHISPNSLAAEIGSDWSRHLNQSKELKDYLFFLLNHKIDLAPKGNFFKTTENFLFPVHNILDEDTKNFIKQHHLYAEISWLQTVIFDFFPDTDFEIELLPAEDEEETLLALRIYGSLSTSDFRNKRHAICQDMIKAGHEKLFKVISIFQRRMHTDGRKAFSYYSSLSAA